MEVRTRVAGPSDCWADRRAATGAEHAEHRNHAYGSMAQESLTLRQPGVSASHQNGQGSHATVVKSKRQAGTFVSVGRRQDPEFVFKSAPRGIRTPDPLFRRQMLYPLS